MKKVVLKCLKNMSALSLGVTVLSANSPSMWFVHQPKEPKELDKLKKIR